MKKWLKSITAFTFLSGIATGLSAATPSVEAAAVDRVLQPYYSITNALAGDDLDGAKAAARDLKQAADGNEALSAANLAADRITDASDLASARRGLSELTVDVRHLLADVGTVGNVPVFVVHCPMAFDGRGADWLQRDKAVSNPYFGAMMLKCGTVSDVLGSEAPASAGGK